MEYLPLEEKDFDDYTKWQREYFDAKTPEEISREAAEYAKANPYTGNAVRV